MALKKDKNFETTYTRQGIPIGGRAVMTTNMVWRRLCPFGSAATKTTADDPNQLDLNAGLNLDNILGRSIAGWKLKILDPSHYQICNIVDNVDSADNTVTLYNDIDYYATLPSTINWVAYPEPLFPITLFLDEVGEVEIGFLNSEAATVSYDDDHFTYKIERTTSDKYAGVKIHTDRMDSIVLQSLSGLAGTPPTLPVYWGEAEPLL